jgi:hypothetical protein
MSARAVVGPIHPRGLTREDAAAYCGLAPEGFDQWVKRGLVPGPIPGTQRWDRKAIDLALDRASGLDTIKGSAFDTWKARRAG